MRVLLVTNMYPSLEDPAYGSFVARQQGRLTTEQGIGFVLVSSGRRGGGSASLGKYLSLAARTLAAAARGGYDLVHAHYLTPTALLGLVASVLRGKPLVITAHGTDIYSGRGALIRMGIRAAVRRSCRVITVSRFLAGELTAAFGPPKREVLVSDMGVDTERFVPGDKSRLKASLGMSDAVPHLVYVGSFTEHKGVEDLADALALLADRGVAFRATLVGDGPLKDDIEERLHHLGDRVRLAPSSPHTKLPGLLAAADLFVLPSRREGVGLLVCLEALSCGVPVVATRAGGLPELVKDGMNGALVDPADPIALAATIEALCADPMRLAALGSKARESALPHDERRQAERVAQVYARCVGDGDARDHATDATAAADDARRQADAAAAADARRQAADEAGHTGASLRMTEVRG